MENSNAVPVWLQPAINAGLQLAVLVALALGDLDADQLQILAFVLSGSWMAKSAISVVRKKK